MAKKKKKKAARKNARGPSFQDLFGLASPAELFDRLGLSESASESQILDVARSFVDRLVGPQQGPRSSSDPSLSASQRVELLVLESHTAPNRQDRRKLLLEALTIAPESLLALTNFAEVAGSQADGVRYFERADALAFAELAEVRRAGDEESREAIEAMFTACHIRMRLAEKQWLMGHRGQAIATLQTIVNESWEIEERVRDLLATYLLQEDRNEEAAALFDKFASKRSRSQRCGRALLAFRKEGDSAAARALALEVEDSTPGLLELLADSSPLTEDTDLDFDDEEGELRDMAISWLPAWRYTPGARAWLRGILDAQRSQRGRKKAAKKAKQAKKSKTPTVGRAVAIDALPIVDETWQIDVLPAPTWTKTGEIYHRTWIGLALNIKEDHVLHSATWIEAPTPDELREFWHRSLTKPKFGSPRRPARVEYRAGSPIAVLASSISALGIEGTAVAQMLDMESLYRGLASHLVGPTEDEGLRNIPGFTTERGHEFFAAAADFYRAHVWRNVAYDSIVRMDVGTDPPRSWYFVICGQSGLSPGLSIHQDLRALQNFLSREDCEWDRPKSSVVFSEPFEVFPLDLLDCELNHWPLADPENFPEVLHMNEDGQSGLPPPEVFDALELGLRAIPEFERRRKQTDLTPETLTVPFRGQQVEVRLCWEPAPGQPGP